MLAAISSRLTFANVVSVIALFVALGGGAYAVSTAPRNSVVSKSIKDGAVQNQDLASPAVNGSKVFPDSLGGEQIDESTLGTVPNATNATDAADSELLDGKNSSDFVVPGSEGWTPLPLLNDEENCHFANYASGFNSAGYFRDPAGVVHLRGLVQAIDGNNFSCGDGTNFILGTGLPAGYRPANQELFTINSNDKPGRIDMGTSGVLVLEPNYPTWADAKVWFSLDGISYRCAPSGQDGCP